MIFKKLSRLGLLLGLASAVMIGQAEINSSGWDPVSPPDPDEPVLSHVMILSSDPQGTCDFNYKARTRLFEGQEVEIYAYPRTGFRLVNITVGDSVITERGLKYTMGSEDVEITAHLVYDPDNLPDPDVMPYQRTVRVTSYPKGVSSFHFRTDYSGSWGNVGRFYDGDSVQISPSYNKNYKLDYWTVNGEKVQSNQTEELVTNVDGVNLDVVAFFSYDPESPGNPDANYWNPETGELVMDDFVPGNLAEAIYARLGNTWDWSNVTSVKVKNKAADYDFYCTDYMTNAEIVDYSRVSGLRNLYPSSFEYCNVREVLLPASVERLYWGQFYQCKNLQSVTIYAFVPPTTDGDVFSYFPNINNCVLYVPASSIALYEIAPGWKEFYDIRPIIENVYTLTVNLPKESADGRYKNYRIELVNVDSEVSQKYVVSDRTEYTFNGMLEDEHYNVYLYTPSGIQVGAIEDIIIAKTGDEESINVSFEAITNVYNAKVAVKAAGNDVTEQTAIEWYLKDAEGSEQPLRKGASVSEIPDGTVLAYTITLNEALGTKYIAPAEQILTINSENANATVTLVPFPSVVYTGVVTDENKVPMTGASVSLTQVLNGKYSKTFAGVTGTDGNWSITALNGGETQASYAAPDYVTAKSTIDAPAESAETVNCGTVILKPVDGCRIQYGFTFTPASLAGVEPEVEPLYSDYKNVKVTVYNKTQDCPQERISEQYPQLVILDNNVQPGDILAITATSTNGGFEPITVDATVDENNTGKVTFPIVGRGAIKASYDNAEAPEINAYLYGPDGNFIQKLAYNNENKAEFSELNDGAYSIVSMAKSDYIDFQQKVGGFEELGLTAGQDFVKSNVNVNRGVISTLRIENVPTLNEAKLFYTDPTHTSITLNKPEITVGNYLTVRVQMDFQQRYLTGIDNVMLRIDLPAKAELVPNSIMIGNSISAYTIEGNRVIIPMGSRYRELVKFCVIPVEAGSFNASATVAFDYQAYSKVQPIGTAKATINELKLSVPSYIGKPTFTAAGQGRANSKVCVYDGNKLIGEGRVNAAGEYSVLCDLGDVYNLSSHPIHAEVTYTVDKKDFVLKSQVKECTYDRTAIQVSKVIMYHYNPEHSKTFESIFDYQNPKTIPTQWTVYYPNKKFTYTVEFTNNSPEFVDNVRLHVLTGGGDWFEYEPTYDKKKDMWVVNVDMGHSADGKYPVNVSMDYTVLSKSMIDGRQLDDLYNELIEFIASMKGSKDGIKEAIIALKDAADAASLNYETLREALSDISNADLAVDEATAAQYAAMSDADIASAVAEQIAKGTALISEASDAYSNIDNYFYNYQPKYSYEVEGITGKNNTVSVDAAGQLNPAALIEAGYEKLYISDDQDVYEYCDPTSYDKLDGVRDRKFNIVPTDGATIAQPEWTVSYIQTQQYFNKILKNSTKYGENLTTLFANINANKNVLVATLESIETNLMAAYDVEATRAAQGVAGAEANLRNIAKAMAEIEGIRAFLARIVRINGKMSKVGSAMQDWNKWVMKVIEFGYRLDLLYIPECNALTAEEIESLKIRIANLRILYYQYYGKHVGRYGQTNMDGTLATAIDACIYTMRYLDQRSEQVRDEQFTRDFENELIAIEKILAKWKKLCSDNPKPQPITPLDPIFPNDIVQIDPSGYVYEGVEDNRVPSVEATIYYKETILNMYDEEEENIVVWDAENYGQENPLYTDENGMYRWDVPAGMWQVKFEKEGYETAYSDWLPVPPPQLDVNIGIVQNTVPEVAEIHAYNDGIELIFDKYMKPATFEGHIYVIDDNSNIVTGYPEVSDGEFVKKVFFRFNEELNTDESAESVSEVTAMATKDILSYAGVPLSAYSQTISLETRIKDIVVYDNKEVVETIDVNTARTKQITIVADPAEAAAGRKLIVTTTAPAIVSLIEGAQTVQQITVPFNAKGEAKFTIQGELPGEAALRLSVEASTYNELVDVTVIQADLPPFTLGDSNDDGEIDVADVTTTISYILGNNPIKFNRDAANVNGDNDIDVADVTGTISIILNAGANNIPQRLPAISMPVGAAFETETLNIEAGETRTMDVAITNWSDFAAMQMDVTMPEGLTLVDVEIAEGNAAHSVAARNGRIVVTSMSNSNFSEAAIVRLTVRADADFVAGDEIVLHSGVATEVSGREINSYEIESLYVATNATSGVGASIVSNLRIRVIDHTLYIESPEDMSLTLSDMLGRGRQLDVRQGANSYDIPVDGVYIINGKKIVVR